MSFARLILGLKLEDRANLHKSGLGPQHGDERHLLVKLVTKSNKKSID
jgi:hypothetical protein